MDKRLFLDFFETLMVLAAGWVYRLPADTLNREKSKNKLLTIGFLNTKNKWSFFKNRLLVSAAAR
jgi:hypothetical protein